MRIIGTIMAGSALLLLLICLAALQAAFAQAPQERRIALLIGNAEYDEAVGPLKNPLNDIAELKRSLMATGFRESDIKVVANARLVDLRREMDAFADRAAALRPNDIAFFYYSGHGAARAATGANYLIPVDAPRADTEDLWFASLPLEEAIGTLKRGTRAATFVVIDACRNELKLARNGKDVTGSAGKAFAAVPTESGMLIAFAADQGQVAREGASRVAGGRLSPYAAALARSLTTPNLPATAAFQAVRPQVVEWTGGAQEPVYTSKLNRDPVFVRTAVTAPGPDPGVTAELERLRRENAELRQPKAEGTRVAESTVRAPPLSVPTATAGVDARSTPASTRAPLVSNPASLPDFALFRECENCPEMVVIPAGNFSMGSPANEAGRAGNEDSQAGAGGGQIRVSLRRFAISRFETTWEEWGACVSAGICQQGPVDKAGGDNGWGRGRRPIIEVDWNDAGAFAGWVNNRSGGGYRRPTEAEWEYAARAGTTRAYPWGDAFDAGKANDGSKPTLAGFFPANPWGLHDMHGNVWEWVEDCYADSYAGALTNGAAATTKSCANRVDRGGSWSNFPQVLRSAYRGGYTPTNRYDNIGFRLARTL